jgi:hypothetical protein
MMQDIFRWLSYIIIIGGVLFVLVPALSISIITFLPYFLAGCMMTWDSLVKFFKEFFTWKK